MRSDLNDKKDMKKLWIAIILLIVLQILQSVGYIFGGYKLKESIEESMREIISGTITSNETQK